MIRLAIFIFVLFLFTSCVRTIKFIPEKSDNYKIDKNKVLLSNHNFDIEVEGLYGKADLDVLFSVFEIEIKNVKDTILFPIGSINLMSIDDTTYFDIDRFNHVDGVGNNLIVTPKNNYSIFIEFSINDTTPIEQITNINSVKLSINGQNKLRDISFNKDIVFLTK